MKPATRLRLFMLLTVTLWLGACSDDSADDAATDATDTSAADAADVADDTSAPEDAVDDTSAPEDAVDAATDAGEEVDAGPQMIEDPGEGPWDIFAPGPYEVGYRRIKIDYTPEGYEGGAPRSIGVAIWYPSLQLEGGRGNARYAQILPRDEVLWEIALAPTDAPRPLLLFSHGNAALAEQSFFMTEYYASHGWIVASPDHTDNTFVDTEGSINLSSGVVRPQDMTAVLDRLLDELPTDDPLYGAISREHIAISGHSFGGYTTLAITGVEFDIDGLMAMCDSGELSGRYCQLVETPEYLPLFREGFLDERIKVAAPQAPGGGIVFQDGPSAITTPTLLMTGAMDASTPNDEDGDPIWDAMVGDQHVRMDLTLGGHFTFSNMCDFFPFIEMVYNDGCSEAFIPPAIAYDIVNVYSMAFFRYHLFGDETHLDLFSGASDAPFAEHFTMSHKDAAP